MPLEVLTTPSFARAAKKLDAKDKKVSDQAIKSVADDPTLGQEKKGDLLGVFVHKFKLKNQETLLAYCLRPDKLNPIEMVLLAVGPHENFFVQLQR